MSILDQEHPQIQAELPASNWTFQLSSAISLFVALLPVMFYGLTHVWFLDIGTKHRAMQALALLGGAVGGWELLRRVRLIEVWIPVAVFSAFILHVVATAKLHPATSEYGESKIQYLMVVLFFGFLYVPYVLRNNRQRLSMFFESLFALAIIYCAICLLAGVSPDNARKTSIDVNPAIMSRMCLIAAGFAYLKFIRTGRWIFMSILFLSVIAGVRTGSRGPILACAAASSFVSLLQLDRKKLVRIGFISSATLVIAAVVLSILPSDVRNRFSPEALLYETSTRREGGRGDLFNTAVEILKVDQWGIGFGNYGLHHRFVVVPHNLILELAVEMSIVWSAIFLGLMAISIYRLATLVRSGATYVESAALFMLVYQTINSLNGGESTIQSLLLYSMMSLSFIFCHKHNQSNPKQIAG